MAEQHWQAISPATRQKIKAAADAAYQHTYHSGLDAATRLIMRNYLKAVSRWQDELEDAEAEIRRAHGGEDVDPIAWATTGKPVADSLLERLKRRAGEGPVAHGES